jgi:hypothetical protein
MRRRHAVLLLLLCGCARDPGRVHTAPPVTGQGSASVPVGTSAEPSAAVQPADSARRASADAPAATPCGPLGCTLYDTPEAAFAAVLASGPQVLAVGEAHAQKSSDGVESATHRFMTALLPRLAGRARHLVIEIWIGRNDCVKTEQKVKEKQKPVTAPQAESNQNEFVELGTQSKALSIQPHALRATCQDYDDIVRAGDDGVGVMLEKIAKMTASSVEALLGRAGSSEMIVAYGGALHNDLVPRAGREKMSFGPELDRSTQGKYVELDLIVPEYIKDTDVWRALEWYPAYDRARFGDRTVLFQPRPRSYVLVFPMTRPASPPAAGR